MLLLLLLGHRMVETRFESGNSTSPLGIRLVPRVLSRSRLRQNFAIYYLGEILKSVIRSFPTVIEHAIKNVCLYFCFRRPVSSGGRAPDCCAGGSQVQTSTGPTLRVFK